MSTDINISNYEGYLLSYIDGELDAGEQVALMAFLERHPAIKQELTLWQSAKLPQEDDAPVFGNKAMLYRGGDIHLGNYETYLLSYIDNELNAEETRLFEQFVRQHPQVKQELLLWQATRQHPDTSVVFENKSLLYRHTEERKTVRLRPVLWWASAAAVVAGLLIWQLPQLNTATTVNGPQLAVTTPSQPQTSQPVQQQEATTTAAVKEPVVTPATPGKPAPQPQKAVQPVPDIAAAAVPPPADSRPTQPTIASITPAESKLVTTDIVNSKTSEINRELLAQNASKASQELTDATLAANKKEEQVQESTVKPVAEATPVQGELIMSVSSAGDNRMMDRVTNVARFFAKKRK